MQNDMPILRCIDINNSGIPSYEYRHIDKIIWMLLLINRRLFLSCDRYLYHTDLRVIYSLKISIY